MISLGISWFSYEVLTILSNNENLIQAWKYTPILVNGIYFVFLGQFLNLSTLYDKTKTKYLVFSTLVGTVSNIVLSFFLIDEFGTYGAALAAALSFGLMTSIQVFISQKVNLIKYNLKLLFLVTAVVTPISFIQYVPLEQNFLTILKIFLYLGIVLTYLYYIGHKYDIKQLLLDRFRK